MNTLVGNSISSESSGNQRWWPVLLCLLVLMLATISPPEDFKAARFGTETILPPALIKLGKLLSRGLSLTLISYCIFQTMGKKQFWTSFNSMLPIFAFGGFACLSVLWSAEKSVSLVQAGSFVLLLLLALLISIYWSDERDTSRLLRFVSIVMACISLGLVFLHFAKPGVGALTRDSSGVFHSTMSGATASLALVVLFSCRVIWAWDWTKQLIGPVSIIHVAAMLIGGNRLSFALAILICGAVFCLASGIKSVALAGIMVSVTGVIVLCLDPGLLLADGLIEKISDFTIQGQSRYQLGSFSGRAEMWEKVWESFLQSPWLGHGYFVTSTSGRIFVWGEWGNWTAHNMVLQLLATVGIIGALLFTIGIGNIAIRVVFKIGCADVAKHRLAFLLFLIGIWYLGWGILNESFFGPSSPESVMFGVVLGLGSALAIQPDEPSDPEKQNVKSL